MAQDDLSNWLKVSAENKITVKNTWQSTLIEHFTDISKFRAKGTVNFQKASCTLEGCMKVYSTRVDDVSDKTLKLLEIFNKEDESKKKYATKKKSNFLEKNLQNINLKENNSSNFYDPIFSFVLLKTDSYFLQDILEQTNSGLHLYTNPVDEIVMGDEKIEIDIDMLPICDSLKEFGNLEQVASRREEFNEPNFDVEFNDYNEEEKSDDLVLDTNINEQNPLECIEIYHETPFGYFKGWTGPYSWKIDLKREKNPIPVSTVPKQKFYIDFTKNIDFSALDNKADTILSKESILERRKTKNLLPEDYSYEIKDLYRYFIKEGHFSTQQKPISSVNLDLNLVNNEIIMPTNQTHEDNYDYAADDYQDVDLSSQLQHSLAFDRNLDENLPSNIKFTRVPKRVDMKRLKDNVKRSISANKNSLVEIFQDIDSYYSPKEAKDISVHFCLISILHLANEYNLLLSDKNDNVTVLEQK